MKKYNSQVSNYVDLLVTEMVLEDTIFSKKAQVASIMSSVVDKIKNYVNNNIDPNDKVGSVLNMVAPGIISTTLGAFGLGKLGMLFGLAARFFHIDIAGILLIYLARIKIGTKR